jgi:serine/threonine protein kinase
MAPLELDSVGEYSLVDRLVDEPGAGRVFLGRRRGDDGLVAIKVLDAEDGELRSAFVDRAEFLKKLAHPNATRVLASGTLERGGLPWSASEHVRGANFAELLTQGLLKDESLALKIALAVCQALADAEEKLGYHGDVRPRNIVVTASGGVRLVDRGFPSRHGPFLFPGSPDYAAFELFEGRIDVDVRADLHALGICLFLAATGLNPIAEALDDNRPPCEVPDPRDIDPLVSPAYAEILAGLCARNRDHRYESPRKAGQDIVRALRGESPSGPEGKFAVIALDALVRASKVFADPTALVAAHDKVAPRQEEPPSPPDPRADPKAQVGTTRRHKIVRGYFDGPAETPIVPALPPLAKGTGKIPFPPPDASDAAPRSVDTGWKDRVTFQAASGQGQSMDWREVAQKREHFFRQATASEETVPAQPRPGEEVLDADEEKARGETSGRMILAEEREGAYQVVRELGRGGQGIVYLVRVMGNQRFEGFSEPVEEAVLKTSEIPEALERERAVYVNPNPGIVKLLDKGKISGRRDYLVMERLYLHPFQLFSAKEKRMNVDVATAIDTFVNLLETLNSLHMRREGPIVLCDVKPGNIMLRMQNKGGTPSLQEFLRRIAAGAYEPVFMDMGCAQSREALRATNGKLEQLLGTPVYMPPEATPLFGNERYEPGTYSPKMDVYALTLTLYEHLTADRPYRAQGLYRHTGRDLLHECLELKRRRASPIDPELLTNLLGAEAKVIRRILELGLAPDPDRRPPALSLLEECKRTFKVKQNFVKTVSEYRYDEAKGLRLVQERYPRIDPAENRYLDFRKSAAGLKGPGVGRPADQLTIDEWFDSREDAKVDLPAE